MIDQYDYLWTSEKFGLGADLIRGDYYSSFGYIIYDTKTRITLMIVQRNILHLRKGKGRRVQWTVFSVHFQPSAMLIAESKKA